MDKKTIIKEFSKFLKKNNAYLQYKTNIAKQNYHKNDFSEGFNYGFDKHIIKWIEIPFNTKYQKQYVLSFLTHPFTWANSKEGYHFWDELNMKWQKKVKSKKLWHYE